MTGKPENPPAFPLSPGDVPYYDSGMSLRDWFAGQALVAMGDRRWDSEDGCTATEVAALAAYATADAMLKARES